MSLPGSQFLYVDSLAHKHGTEPADVFRKFAQITVTPRAKKPVPFTARIGNIAVKPRAGHGFDSELIIVANEKAREAKPTDAKITEEDSKAPELDSKEKESVTEKTDGWIQEYHLDAAARQQRQREIDAQNLAPWLRPVIINPPLVTPPQQQAGDSESETENKKKDKDKDKDKKKEKKKDKDKDKEKDEFRLQEKEFELRERELDTRERELNVRESEIKDRERKAKAGQHGRSHGGHCRLHRGRGRGRGRSRGRDGDRSSSTSPSTSPSRSPSPRHHTHSHSQSHKHHRHEHEHTHKRMHRRRSPCSRGHARSRSRSRSRSPLPSTPPQQQQPQFVLLAPVSAAAGGPMHSQPASQAAFTLPALAHPNVQTQVQPLPLTPAQYIAAALQLPR